MINKLLRKYNQNRKSIFTVILIIVFSYILLQSIFSMIRSNRDKKINNILEQIQQENMDNNINSDINTNEKEEQNVSETAEKAKTNEQLIIQFVELCNQKQIEKAYNMVSTDCKNSVFPDISSFKKNYVDKIFNQNKSVKITNSIYGNDIYNVSFYNNILSSGGNASKNILTDYIHISKEGKEKKLNLNKFIQVKQKTNISTKDKITIKIQEIQVYLDYEIYTINITNNSLQTILVGKQEDVKSVCLIDKNNVEYSSNLDELPIETLIIDSNVNKTIHLKFNKVYDTGREIERVKFTIIDDYNAYLKNEQYKELIHNIKQ